MAGPDPVWSTALVMAGLRRYFTSQPRFGDSPGSCAVIAERARDVLGSTSPEYRALTMRTAPAALSLREMVRAGIGWHGSRSELYRRSHNGAVRIAVALRRDAVPIPDALQTGASTDGRRNS